MEDFEVHPRGTSEELRVLRKFVKEISDIVNASDCGDELKSSVAALNLWYARVINNEVYHASTLRNQFQTEEKT